MLLCHHKLGKVENDGYQYCIKCGKAFVVECNHIFSDVSELEIYQKRNQYPYDKVVKGYKKIVKCKKCGIYKEFVFNDNLYKEK